MDKQSVWICLDKNFNKQDDQSKYAKNKKKKLAIILAYFNGFRYLEEQIDTILNQTFNSFDLYISDDCSDLYSKISQLKISNVLKRKIFIQYRTKNLGYASNFLTALREIPKKYDYYAFSDQDDIWRKNKIKVSLDAVNKYDENIPCLYGSRTESVDFTGKKLLGTSKIFIKKPSFQNALVQNISGGNTMFFNYKAYKLIIDSSKDNNIVAHDWWSYLIIAGAGGNVIYDNFISLKYRQHKNNEVGRNNSINGSILRIFRLFKGVFKSNIDNNIKALIKNKYFLTKQNKIYLENFIKYKNSNYFKRIFFFKKAGIYRQTFIGNIGLIIGAIFNRI